MIIWILASGLPQLRVENRKNSRILHADVMWGATTKKTPGVCQKMYLTMWTCQVKLGRWAQKDLTFIPYVTRYDFSVRTSHNRSFHDATITRRKIPMSRWWSTADDRASHPYGWRDHRNQRDRRLGVAVQDIDSRRKQITVCRLKTCASSHG